MKTFRDLLIWQKAMEMVLAIYNETRCFPNDEKYGLVTQMRRSAVSIPSNMAEGYGRNSKGDFKRFLQISMGALFEVQTQLEIAMQLGYLGDKKYKNLYEGSREIERMLSSFIKSLIP